MENKSFVFNCHDYHDSCIDLLKNKFIVMIQYSLKLYAFYHSIPMLIGKRTKFFTKENILKLLKRIIKSSLYMTLFILIVRGGTCLISNLYGKISILSAIILSIIAPITVLIEDQRRIVDYTLFVLPRSIEGIFDLLVKLEYLTEVKNGLSFIFALSTTLMYLLNEADDLNDRLNKLFNFITC